MDAVAALRYDSTDLLQTHLASVIHLQGASRHDVDVYLSLLERPASLSYVLLSATPSSPLEYKPPHSVAFMLA